MKEKIMTDGKTCLKRAAFFFAIIVVYIFTTPFMFDIQIWDSHALTSAVRYYLWNYLPWLILICVVFISFREKTFDFKLILLSILVWIVIFISNCANSVPTERLVWASHRTMVCLLGAGALLNSKRRAALTFKALDCLYIIVAVLIIAFKTVPAVSRVLIGWEYDSFLGGDNRSTWPLFFGALYAMLDYYYNSSLFRPAVYGVLLIVAEYFLWCATALVGILIIAVCLLPFMRRVLSSMRSEAIVVASLLLAIFFVFFFEKLCAFAPVRFITDSVLHKDVSLTGRTIIWAGIRPLVLEKPLLGHGLAEPGFFMDEIYNHTTVHAHNFFLQAFYEGGLASVLAGIVMMFYCCREVRKKNDKQLVYILNVVSLAMLVMLQSDQPAYWSWYPVMMLYGIMASIPSKNNGLLPDEGTLE